MLTPKRAALLDTYWTRTRQVLGTHSKPTGCTVLDTFWAHTRHLLDAYCTCHFQFLWKIITCTIKFLRKCIPRVAQPEWKGVNTYWTHTEHLHPAPKWTSTGRPLNTYSTGIYCTALAKLNFSGKSLLVPLICCGKCIVNTAQAYCTGHVSTVLETCWTPPGHVLDIH